MRARKNASAIFLLLLIVASPLPRTGATEGSTFKLYFLSGQSNMVGFGRNADLSEDDVKDLHGVPIFTGNSVPDAGEGGGDGKWATLSPGYGFGAYFDGENYHLSDRFGPEISFANQLMNLNPNDKIAIVKYARGGTSLSPFAPNYGTWDPDFAGGNRRSQYDNALSAIAKSLKTQDIDGDGIEDILVPTAIIWMQGESDAISKISASSYQQNLKQLMELFRTALHNDELPIVVGKITDSGIGGGKVMMEHIDFVHGAQQAFVFSDVCASYMIKTDGYDHSDDGWHYTSEGYLDMGKSFALEAHQLAEECPKLKTTKSENLE